MCGVLSCSCGGSLITKTEGNGLVHFIIVGLIFDLGGYFIIWIYLCVFVCENTRVRVCVDFRGKVCQRPYLSVYALPPRLGLSQSHF